MPRFCSFQFWTGLDQLWSRSGPIPFARCEKSPQPGGFTTSKRHFFWERIELKFLSQKKCRLLVVKPLTVGVFHNEQTDFVRWADPGVVGRSQDRAGWPARTGGRSGSGWSARRARRRAPQGFALGGAGDPQGAPKERPDFFRSGRDGPCRPGCSKPASHFSSVRFFAFSHLKGNSRGHGRKNRPKKRARTPRNGRVARTTRKKRSNKITE